MAVEKLPWDQVKMVKTECIVCGAKLTGGKELFERMRKRNVCPVCQLYGSTEITVTYHSDAKKVLEQATAEMKGDE